MLPFHLYRLRIIAKKYQNFTQRTITKSVEKQVQKNFIDVDVISDGISHDDEECIIELLIMTEWW